MMGINYDIIWVKEDNGRSHPLVISPEIFEPESTSQGSSVFDLVSGSEMEEELGLSPLKK